jgi:hypothetical protein
MKPLAGLFSYLAFALLTTPGCAELGQLNIPGDYGTANVDVVGEVQNVDTRSRQIEIRTDAGRTLNVQYDNPVSTQQDRDGRLYADLVTVRESVQERNGSGPQRGGSSRDRAGRLDRLEGTVENIDSRRGQFEVRGRDNRTIIVSLQYNAPRTVSDRFDRLREGDTVRMEGRFLNQDRFELENFL